MQGPPSKRHLIKPERVLVYTKKMEVRWRALVAGLQGVRSLDDIIRVDLDFLRRHLPAPARTCLTHPCRAGHHSESCTLACASVVTRCRGMNLIMSAPRFRS